MHHSNIFFQVYNNKICQNIFSKQKHPNLKWLFDVQNMLFYIENQTSPIDKIIERLYNNNKLYKGVNMDAQIEFSLDEKSKPAGNIKVDIANRDNTILVGDNSNKSMIAITFHPDKITLDIDNNNGKFDTLATVCDYKVNNTLQFNVRNITINPDLSINLTLNNSAVNGLLIRPDEIARVNSKGVETTIYSSVDLMNTSLPKNLLELKTRLDGFDQFPSQLFNTISSFNNTDTSSFDINGKELLIAKTANNIFVSDGEFLKKIDNSKTLFNTKKDENTMQFCFEDENKNLTKISDETFNDICAFLNLNPNDNNHQTTSENLEHASEVEKSEPFKYIKSQSNIYQNIKAPNAKPKQAGEQKPSSSKPAAAKESKGKEETIDLTYPMKLLGFALFFIGFFGGGLLPIILGICIGGSGFAFSAPLEKVKVGGSKLGHAKKESKKKNKKSQDDEEQKLTNKDLANMRIDTLSKMQQKYQNILGSLQALYSSHQNVKTNILQKIQNATDQTELGQLNTLLAAVDKALAKIKTNINEYESTFNIYDKLMGDSATELQKTVQVADNDEAKLYEDFETKHNQMLAERKTLANLEQQLNQFKSKLATVTDPAAKQTLANQIAQTQTKVQAQKVTESLATKSADDARNLFNLTKAGKKLYSENMDGSLTYNNIQKGIKLLEDYKNETEQLAMQIRQNVSQNQYTQDIEFAI